MRPNKAHHVLRISPIGISKLSLGPSDVSCQWRHAAVARNGAIYAMPWEASAVLRVATDVQLLGHLGVTNQGKFGFTVAAQDGRRWVMKDAESQDRETDGYSKWRFQY